MSKQSQRECQPLSRSTRKVGVLDWGVGGFGAVMDLRARGVTSPIVYVSDSGVTPYGRMDEDALSARVQSMCARLAAEGCDAIVVACNAASTVLHTVDVGDVRAVGMIECTARHLKEWEYAEVGLLGGRRTVESEAYPRALTALACKTRIRARVGQPLSALVEAGILEGEGLQNAIEEVVAPLRDVSVLVSACTHYAAIRSRIERSLPNLERWIEPATLAVSSMLDTGVVVSERLHRVAVWDPKEDRAFTSGDGGALARGAFAAFGVVVSDVQKLSG